MERKSDDCVVNPLSSRGCEFGTKGCDVDHDKAARAAYEAEKAAAMAEAEAFLKTWGQDRALLTGALAGRFTIHKRELEDAYYRGWEAGMANVSS